ncbi:PIG-L family deacetylase [Cetobacterium sp. 2A]|uniref:PIG-L deacetylase family protein n=1 Tax=Cetobacterium sp. 2A TaxID=2754723 RepID=UPI00163CA9C1|nr:PIG-L deacetylase family protein [Cetobacterium sp. 2A]MBC2856179.1 PIG-L family deacetylase [Cetobacterium sp. 2A]
MRILVIAAHPDDEILGCGGTINSYSRQGHEVYVYIVTDGSSAQYPNDIKKLNSKRREAVEANKKLGVKKVIFGNLPDMKLDTVSHINLNGEIFKVVNEIRPDIVFTQHYGDVNKDHKLVFEATLVACRPTENGVKKIYSYETLSSTEWGNTNSSDFFIPNTYVRLTGEDILNKKEAMNFYQTELRDYPHPRSLEAIENLAKYRGNQVIASYAESFILIREIK